MCSSPETATAPAESSDDECDEAEGETSGLKTSGTALPTDNEQQAQDSDSDSTCMIFRLVIHTRFAGNADGEYVPQGDESSESSDDENGVDDESDGDEDNEEDLSEVRVVV